MADISINLKCLSRLSTLQCLSYTKTLCSSTSFYQRYKSVVTPDKSHNKQGCRLYSCDRFKRETTLSKLIQSWIKILTRNGVPESDSSVNLIVAHALGKKMIHEVNMSTQPPAHVLKRIDEMCKERLKRIPVQYIIGEWDFHDMTLTMKPPVLIPRPETEELASIIVNNWPRGRKHGGKFLEIGCGTGALSLYILKQISQVTCVAVDKNATACKLTLENAARYNLEHRLHVVHGDIYDESVIYDLPSSGPFDVIVSNPPYLTSDEMNHIEAEVAYYEDHGALHGGVDGLDLIQQILAVSHGFLRTKNSIIWLEVGLQQPNKIKKLVESHPEYMLSYEETMKDFTRRERFCKLRLKR